MFTIPGQTIGKNDIVLPTLKPLKSKKVLFLLTSNIPKVSSTLFRFRRDETVDSDPGDRRWEKIMGCSRGICMGFSQPTWTFNHVSCLEYDHT